MDRAPEVDCEDLKRRVEMELGIKLFIVVHRAGVITSAIPATATGFINPRHPRHRHRLFAHVHIHPSDLASLPFRFGRHGTLPHVNPDSLDLSASYHDAAYYGSLAAVWHYT